jgi:hypothetical protein
MDIFVPGNLEIDKLLSVYPPDEIENFSRDKLLYILNIISETASRNKRENIKNGYVILYSRIVQRSIHNYRQYFDYLIRTKVIESDNHYINPNYLPGYAEMEPKSKGYRFTHEYKTKLKKERIKSYILAKHHHRQSPFGINMCSKHKFLNQWFSGLEINYDIALRYLDAELDYKLMNPDKRDFDFKENRYKDPFDQYNAALINLERINNHDFYTSADPNVQRFHSNITNLNSDIRNCLLYKGRELYSIDITNSQPYLSTKLLNPLFYSDLKNSHRADFSLFFNIYKILSKYIIKTFIGTPTLLMLVKTLEGANNQDVIEYVKIATSGRFYEFLQNNYHDKLGKTYHNRKEIKASVFQVLFTDNRYFGQPDAEPKKLFASIFPVVYIIFSLLKKKDSTLLPRLLQRIESFLILDVICKRISKERPDCPIFTIHDSISTTQENIDFVKQIMTEELTRYIGYPPVLKTEPWCLENLNSKFFQLIPETSALSALSA